MEAKAVKNASSLLHFSGHRELESGLLNFNLADIDIKTTEKTCPLGVVLDNELKFDDHISRICREVSAQVSALNRLKNILPLKTKESLYRAFILPYFNHCNQVWHHCGKRNTAKIEKVNERALRYIFKDKCVSHQDLLGRIKLPSLKTRRIQDMLLTINNSISDKAPPAAWLAQLGERRGLPSGRSRVQNPTDQHSGSLNN